MDWERRYTEGDTPWDRGTAHPALDGLLAQNVLQGKTLVPGCGAGHDVRLLARHHLRVTGLDIAPSAIERARNFAPVNNETYLCEDFFALPKEWEQSFDSILEHTCFCAIEPNRRTDYIRSATAALKPGGRLLAVFYTDMEDQDGEPPFGATTEDLDALFGKHFRLLEEYRGMPTFSGREGCETIRLLARI